MHSEEFTYYAFISYSHKDAAWAHWLHRKLESYRLPISVRKESARPLPKSLRPIFLDATDLTVGKLNDNLRQELEKSRYLIVICSPASAMPNAQGKHYVNEEVSFFCELGREQNIIPVIVDGSPSDPVKKCFCPKISELGLVGLDATKHSRVRILSDTVAKMLNLRPDELWRREKRRIRRRWFQIALTACFVAALILFGAGMIYDWYHPYIKYYSDYVDQWGKPTGIFPLTEAQTKSRQYHYRFLYLNREMPFGKRVLREVIRCNSVGTPVSSIPDYLSDDFQDHATWQKLEYHTNFDLAHIDVCDSRGVLLERRLFSGKTNNVIDFKKKDKDDVLVGAFQPSSMSSLSGDDDFLETKSEIQRWKIVRDEFGRPATVMFFRDDSAIAPSSCMDGFFGLEYVHDDLGRVIGKYFLNEKGERLTLRNGFFSIQYEYSPDNSQLTAVARLDGKGNEIRKYDLAYDENDNLISFSCSSFGNPVYSRGGYVSSRFKYDKSGNQCERSYHGLQGELCLNKDGVAKKIIRYDEARGVPIETAFFDIDGNPCLSRVNNAKETLQYDEWGNVKEESYFGIDGNLCLTTEGVAKLVAEYDERGNKTVIACFGVDGSPCLNKDGFSSFSTRYNDRGYPTEITYFGVDGEPCLQKDGYAKVTWFFDDRGNPEETAFFSIDGMPCLEREYGYAKEKSLFNEQGNLLETAYFGTDGKPCMIESGYAKYTMLYDELGNLKEESFFDVDGNLCMVKDGYAKFTMQYDERGNRSEITFFDVDGKPCMTEDGYAKFTMQYDSQGNRIEEAYFDVDGKPCLHKNGFTSAVGLYDERGNRIEEAYFGADGNPCMSKNGFAKINKTYDERGNLIERAYFGVDGAPCLIVEGYSKITKKYDDWGNTIEAAFFGTDGEPCLCKNGYARGAGQYDDRGNRTETAYFDVDGKPCVINEGYSKCTMRYDDRGNLIERAYFDVDGNPCLNKIGIAKVTFQYDGEDEMIGTQLYDLDGKLFESE